jgi:hypothetical protein
LTPFFLRQSIAKGFSSNTRQGTNCRRRKPATNKQNGQEIYKQPFHYFKPSICNLAYTSTQEEAVQRWPSAAARDQHSS